MDDPDSPFLKHKLYSCLWDDNYSCLVNDKYLFHCVCKYHRLPVPELYGVYLNGILMGNEKTLSQLIAKKNSGKVICKPIKGVQGKGIHFISRGAINLLAKNTTLERHKSLLDDLKKQDYIVQEFIKQHPDLNKINPHSVNTVRIITFLTADGGVEFLAAMLRTSSNNSYVDNFTSGGIVIGIDLQTGRLYDRGFLKPQFGTTLTKHPLTNINFHSFQIPFWDELKNTAIKAQKIFHQLKSIGWDFAITEDGPVLIEGNIEWGTAGIQAANGGLMTQKNIALFSQHGLSFH